MCAEPAQISGMEIDITFFVGLRKFWTLGFEVSRGRATTFIIMLMDENVGLHSTPHGHAVRPYGRYGTKSSNFFSEPFFIDPSATIGVTSYEAETHPDPEIKRSLKAVTFTMGAYCRLCSPSMLRLCIVRHYSQKDVIGFSVACAERWIDWRKSSYAYSVRAWLGYQSYTRVTGSKTISARELCIRYLARVFCSFANTFVQITNG